MHGGFGGAIGGTALFRFTLSTPARILISLILKIQRQRPNETEQSPYYWKRESEVYRAGMLDNFPPGSFDVPNIYLVEDLEDACWIWMEDLGDTQKDWSLRDYAETAERLGRFNGAWLRQAALPRAPWLSKAWHSAIVPALADVFDRLDHLLVDPLAQMTLPIDAKAEIESIWTSREIYRRALAELPQTLCHFDAFRRNVLYRNRAAYLIDWALAGVGAVGEDLVSLVAVSLYYEGYTQEYAAELDEVVFAGYLTGLRESGWQGDARLARLGYTCGMTLRGLAGVKQDIRLVTNKSNVDHLVQVHNMDSAEDVARFFADIRRFRLLKMAREARSLLAF